MKANDMPVNWICRGTPARSVEMFFIRLPVLGTFPQQDRRISTGNLNKWETGNDRQEPEGKEGSA